MLHYLDLKTTDPAFNLALEQYLLENLPKGSRFFMLWQNEKAVIIGRYQNTLAEINLPYVQKNRIRVVRRLSGGGAVYHDRGNLNYTFISDANEGKTLNMSLFCEPVVRTLEGFGVEAQINGRNDITVGGKKFSGNAQTIRHGRVLHHGTILFDTDLEAVGMSLRVDADKIETKGIRSVRSRVTNLQPLLGRDVSLEAFRQALLCNVAASGEAEEITLSEEALSAIRCIREERYDTWEWNFGRSPACTVIKRRRFEGVGKVEAYLALDHGLIQKASFHGDFFGVQDPEMLAHILEGIRYERGEIEKALFDTDISAFFFGMGKKDLVSLLMD